MKKYKIIAKSPTHLLGLGKILKPGDEPLILDESQIDDEMARAISIGLLKKTEDKPPKKESKPKSGWNKKKKNKSEKSRKKEEEKVKDEPPSEEESSGEKVENKEDK